MIHRLSIILCSLILWALCAAPAFAQSSPGWSYGYVPSPAEWNNAFAKKQDYLGSPPCLVSGCTYTGLVITAAPTTASAGFNLPAGTAPTSPNNGDIWTTTSGLYVRINGATIGPLTGSSGGSFAGTSPITVSFPAGVVTYAFNFSIANTFLAQQTDQGATTTQPGWYAQIAGDTVPRIRVGTNATDVASLAFGPGNANRDAFIERVGAAALRFGSPDAAAPVAQTISVQNVVAGTSNTAGANWTIAGSQGTGTGQGGSILFQTAPAGSSGTAQNVLATAMTIYGSGGVAVGSAAADPGAGVFNVTTGYRIGNAATTAHYLRGNGTNYVDSAIQAGDLPGSFSGFANPTSPGVNLTGSNGVATSALRSDVVLALDQTIAPTWTGQHTHNVARTITSATGASLDDVNVQAATTTISGNTGSPITRLAKVGIYRPTFTDSSAVTVTDAATLYVDNSPLAAGSVTITNAWAILVGAGATKLQATTINAALTYGGVTLANSVTGTGSMVLATAPTISSLTVTTAFTATGLVNYASIQNVAASRLLGNPTGSAAAPSEISLGATLAFSGSALQTTALSGDVTSGANSFSTTIASNAVTNAKAAQMAANTVKGNPTGSTANAQDVVPSTARSSSLLNIDQMTTHGDSIYTIVSTDRVVATSASFTASRTWTLPAANSVNPGQSIIVVDLAGGVTATNTLVISRAGSDTVNGGTTVSISAANGGYELVSDGTSKWSAQPFGSANGTGVTSISCGGATITTSGNCPPEFGFQNCTLAASASGNNLTMALKDNAGSDPTTGSPCNVWFRSGTGSTGSWVQRTVTSATSLVVNAGSTFGVANTSASCDAASSCPFRIWVTLIDTGSTAVLGAVVLTNASGVRSFNPTNVVTTTACNACTNATVIGQMYSTAVQTNAAWTPLGYLDWGSGLGTAGTYASGPTRIQTYGPGIALPGTVLQQLAVVATSATSTTSTSYSTALTQSITPGAAPNLLKVVASTANTAALGLNSGSVGTFNSTQSAVITQQRLEYIAAAAVYTGNLEGYDAPGSTSSQSIILRVRADGTNTASTCSVSNAGDNCVLTVYEIQGALPEVVFDNDNDPRMLNKVG